MCEAEMPGLLSVGKKEVGEQGNYLSLCLIHRGILTGSSWDQQTWHVLLSTDTYWQLMNLLTLTTNVTMLGVTDHDLKSLLSFPLYKVIL